jgi:hypothetical protein
MGRVLGQILRESLDAVREARQLEMGIPTAEGAYKAFKSFSSTVASSSIPFVCSRISSTCSSSSSTRPEM